MAIHKPLSRHDVLLRSWQTRMATTAPYGGRHTLGVRDHRVTRTAPAIGRTPVPSTGPDRPRRPSAQATLPRPVRPVHRATPPGPAAPPPPYPATGVRASAARCSLIAGQPGEFTRECAGELSERPPGRRSRSNFRYPTAWLPASLAAMSFRPVKPAASRIGRSARALERAPSESAEVMTGAGRIIHRSARSPVTRSAIDWQLDTPAHTIGEKRDRRNPDRPDTGDRCPPGGRAPIPSGLDTR